MAKPPRFFVQVKLPKCCDKALVLPVYIYRHDPAGGYTLTSGSFTVDLDCLPELTTALQWALKQARDQRLIEQQGGHHG
jgi:hypothetical protein